MTDINWVKTVQAVDHLYQLRKQENTRNQPLKPMDWVQIGVVCEALTHCYQCLVLDKLAHTTKRGVDKKPEC
jgi:hypothetical protein